MIDFISCEILHPNLDWIRSHENLFFEKTIGDSGGEIIRERSNVYRGCRFLISKAGRAFMHIKLPEYVNGNNYTNLSIGDIFTALSSLEIEFGIDSNQTKIQSFEFGINVTGFNYPINEVLKTYLHHKSEPFQFMKCSGGSRASFGKECIHSQYIIKIYSRSKKYNLKEEILGVEIKVKKMDFIRGSQGINIQFLSELIDQDILNSLKDSLSKIYNQCVKVDPIPNHTLKDLPPSKRELYLSGSIGGEYWRSLKDFNKDTYSSKLKRFQSLVKEYGEPIHKRILQNINDTWNSLLITESTHYLTTLKHLSSKKETIKLVKPINTDSILMPGKYKNNPQLKSVKKCLVCEKNISNKRIDAKTCSYNCRRFLSNSRKNIKESISKVLSQAVSHLP